MLIMSSSNPTIRKKCDRHESPTKHVRGLFRKKRQRRQSSAVNNHCASDSRRDTITRTRTRYTTLKDATGR